jgi:hypothetical protein
VDSTRVGSGSLLGNDQFVELGRTILIFTAVAEDGSKALLNELLGGIAVLTAVGNGHTLALLILAILGLDIVDVDVNVLADKTLAKEPDLVSDA